MNYEVTGPITSLSLVHRLGGKKACAISFYLLVFVGIWLMLVGYCPSFLAWLSVAFFDVVCIVFSGHLGSPRWHKTSCRMAVGKILGPRGDSATACRIGPISCLVFFI